MPLHTISGSDLVDIVSVNQVLAEHGLNAPSLNVLKPDAYNYSVHLFQPEGQIEANQSGVRNRDRARASAQFGEFLAEAKESEADLVVTPEYSTPWEVLHAALDDVNSGPKQGKLWVLGCESIKYSEIKKIKEELVAIAIVIFEEMKPDDNKFVDPLAYIFRTTAQAGGQPQLVVLVQFKTCPMSDPHDFERNTLQLGKTIYQFGSYHVEISLVTFICSDLLVFEDQDARNVYDRALIIHIQLNNLRHHSSLLDFRKRIFQYTGDQTELLTLNWARDTRIYDDDGESSGNNFAGSAWYLKAPDIDLSDTTVAINHHRGFYYTWFGSYKTHALFFNFGSKVFQLNASKVVRLGVTGPAGTRRGPQMNMVKSWDNAQLKWTDSEMPNDGFADICCECGEAAAQIKSSYDQCPLACERLLALCAGNANHRLDWYEPKVLDSFALDIGEPIRRITFCQANHGGAAEFRVRRLRRCANLWTILQTPANLPQPLLNDMNDFVLEWTHNAPHQNLLCQSGERATVMYLGEDSDETTIESTYKVARERVRLSMKEEPGDRAKQRVVLWYRDAMGILKQRWDPPLIDRQLGESEFDIGRTT